MMLYTPLVSLFVALIATSSVAKSSTQVRRDVPSPCPTGPPKCCQVVMNATKGANVLFTSGSLLPQAADAMVGFGCNEYTIGGSW